MGRLGVARVSSASLVGVNSMTKFAKTCPLIAVFGLYLMSNSLNSKAHFINLLEVFGCVALASLGIMSGLQWYELESKGGVFGLRLLTPGLVSPSLDTSPLLLSELSCNSRLDVILGFCL